MPVFARLRERQLNRRMAAWEGRIGAIAVKEVQRITELYRLGAIIMVIGAPTSIIAQYANDTFLAWFSITTALLVGISVVGYALNRVLTVSDQVLQRYHLNASRWTVPIINTTTSRFDKWLDTNRRATSKTA
jgi:hypothetical protein